MEWKSILGIGGFTLGILNLSYIIYKDFLKKSKLEIIEYNFVLGLPEPYPEYYDIQIDIRLHSKFDESYIKEVTLINENDFTNIEHNNIKKIKINKVLPYKTLDILNKTNPNLDESIKNKSFDISDFHLKRKSVNSISINKRLSGIRESDGWEKTPLNGWKLKIKYNKKSYIIKEIKPIIKNYT